MSDTSEERTPRELQPASVPVDRTRIRSGGGRETSMPGRRLMPPWPVGHLGVVAAAPEEVQLESALQVLNGLHGGLGHVVFRVESGLALGADASANAVVAGEAALVAEEIVPSPVLQERFFQAAAPLLQRACEPIAREVLKSGEAQTCEAELAAGRCVVVAVPVMVGRAISLILVRAQEMGHRGEAAPLAALQSAGLIGLLADSRSETRLYRERFAKIAAFVELLGSSAGGLDFSECSRRLANHLKETLGCDLVAVSVKNWRGHRIAAVSGEVGPEDAHSPGRRALLSHLAEAVRLRRTLVSQRDARGATKAGGGSSLSLRDCFDPAVSIGEPLIDRAGQVHGAWVFLWNEVPADLEERKALITAASIEVAPLVTLLHAGKPGRAAGAVLRLWKRGSLTTRRIITGLGIGLLCAALYPHPYPVRATSELQPVVRRVIAAPFDGLLMRSRAKAGDLVKAGDILAEMDGREIRSQLAEAVAERERALRESDQALAAGEIARSRVAALEAEALTHQIETLEYRKSHLEVRSPIEGIILQGNWDRSEGAPLRIGDAMFEIGPLDRFVSEVSVPATEISLVREGAGVTVRLESGTGGVLRGRIGRISPKSELREEKNVFVCEVAIENDEGSLRAGLKGKAKVEGPRRPLIWSWLRRAWLALRYYVW